jgi:ribosomal protein S18 acetylase RimI-like enzyme
MHRLERRVLEWALELTVNDIMPYSACNLLKTSKRRALSSRKNNTIVCFSTQSSAPAEQHTVFDKQPCVSAELSSTPVGFIMFRFARTVMYVFELHVAEPHRSQGIGSMLLLQSIQAYADKTSSVVLYVHKQNTRAQAFYSKNGFKINHTYKNKSFHEMVFNILKQ